MTHPISHAGNSHLQHRWRRVSIRHKQKLHSASSSGSWPQTIGPYPRRCKFGGSVPTAVTADECMAASYRSVSVLLPSRVNNSSEEEGRLKYTIFIFLSSSSHFFILHILFFLSLFFFVFLHFGAVGRDGWTPWPLPSVTDHVVLFIRRNVPGKLILYLEAKVCTMCRMCKEGGSYEVYADLASLKECQDDFSVTPPQF